MEVYQVQTYLFSAEVVLGIALITLVLLQAKGNSASVLGGRNPSATYRPRRGVEKTLFNVTIVIASVLIILALVHPFLLTV